MKLRLQKGFWMMKLLNRNYPAPVRAISALGAYTVAFIATGQSRLAKELASRCWRHNDFKLAARRCAWYLRRSWLAFDVSQDDFFDPTEGMSDVDLVTLEHFLMTRHHKMPPLLCAIDQAFITARRLDNDETPSVRPANIQSFTKACNGLLDQDVQPPASDNPAEKNRAGDFPIESAKQTLSDFIALFPADRLNWFVISGTFLGLVREKGFLAHDYDIDLGIFEDEIDIGTIKDIIKDSKKFVLKKYDHHSSRLFQPDIEPRNRDVPYIFKIIHVSGIHIDLFVHYRDMNASPPSYWHGSSLHRWNNDPFELKTYKFYDYDVLGPVDYDHYLTENYGDWRTPVTVFNCTTDTPNLALVPHPIAVVIFLSRYVIAKGTDKMMTQKLEQELLHNGFLQKQDDGALFFSAALFSEKLKSDPS